MPIISSRQHPLVGQCRAILRGDDRRVLLDGWHLLQDAVAAGLVLDWVAVDEARTAPHADLLDRLATRGTPVVQVTSTVMDAMSPVRVHTGVVSIAQRPSIDARTLIAPSPALVVGAVGIQDPGNVGAIVRAADAAGATGVLLDAQTADPWGWKALRASMGSMFRVPVLRTETVIDEIERWATSGLTLVATDPHHGVSMYDVDLRQPLVLLLGGEGSGLPAALLDRAAARVRIPMRPAVESLNVAVAAALLVYEASRQRGALPS